MTLVIYPDVIFAINYIINYCLLLALFWLCKQKKSYLRITLSAGFGAIMSCFMAVLYQIPIILRFLVFYVIVAAIMIWIAFGRSNIKKLATKVLLLYAITYLVGGALNSFFYHTRVGLGFFQILSSEYETNPVFQFLTLSFILLLPVVQLIYYAVRKLFEYQQEIFNVKLVRKDKHISFQALLDTGNELYDPYYQKPVALIELEKVKNLLSEQEFMLVTKVVEELQSMQEKVNPYQYAIDFPSLHTLHFTSVGKEKGELVAFLMDQIIISCRDRKDIIKDKIIVAIYNKKFSENDEYQMILHKNLVL